MWGLFVLLAVGGASALRSSSAAIPPYVQARSAFTHSRLYLQQKVPHDRNSYGNSNTRNHLAMGIVVAVTAAIAKNSSEGGTEYDALSILDETVPQVWENYNEVSKGVNQILAEAHAKIQPISGKTEDGRAFQAFAVRIRKEEAKRFVRVDGISTT
ncbi:jg20588 [Pararge aegeria aegeria]|uniref:Jg20588 protein n=1 Tax=Pararge aegeria aegeria TaxID=348720 RepID=A0A8S4RRX1_9NEOP|nr:jg20588 [Pararge aegeria aegeria]